jgi:hypothetical protein
MGRPTHPKAAEVLELNDNGRGLEPHLICKRLKLTKGIVAGILWRKRNPRPPSIKRIKPEKFYFHRWSVDFDDDMASRLTAYIKEMKITKTEAVRMVVTFGLESLEGE